MSLDTSIYVRSTTINMAMDSNQDDQCLWYNTIQCNTIQYNSRLLKISKLTKAATAITGYNI